MPVTKQDKFTPSPLRLARADAASQHAWRCPPAGTQMDYFKTMLERRYYPNLRSTTAADFL